MRQNRQTNTPVVHVRHRPESTLLYQVIREYWPEFQAELASHGKNLPAYITREFDEYLKCGRLEHGFLRVTKARRIGRYLERLGLLERDAKSSYLTADAVDEGQGPTDHLLGSSITYRGMVAVDPLRGIGPR